MSKAREIVKVIEPELLSPEEQAELIEAHGELRGSADIIGGSLKKVYGKLRRCNALVKTAPLIADLQMIRDQADGAIAALSRIAS